MEEYELYSEFNSYDNFCSEYEVDDYDIDYDDYESLQDMYLY